MLIAQRLNLDPMVVLAWPEQVMDDVLLVLSRQAAESAAQQQHAR